MAWFGPSGDCGCGCECLCPISWLFSDCYLFWYLCDPPPETDYTVTIVTPTGTEVYENVSQGVFENTASGTYSATLTVDGIESEACEIVIDDCPPVYDCCVRTIGLYGVFSGIGVTELGRTNILAGSPGFTYGGKNLYVLDHSAANVSWYRDLTFLSGGGPKTPTNCYNSFVEGDVLIGSGTDIHYILEQSFGQVVPTCFDESEIPNFVAGHKREVSFDVYLRYVALTVRVVAISTGYTYTAIGAPNSATPATIANGTEANFVNVNPFGSAGAIGSCDPNTDTRNRVSFFGSVSLLNSYSCGDQPVNSVDYLGYPELDV